MPRYRIHALPDAIAREARTSLRSPQYGHPAHVEVAAGYGPCRSCLEQFRIGEEGRLLFTYNPFDGLDAYPSPGPVFIHEQFCDRFEESGFPPGLRSLPLMFEGFGIDRQLIVLERGNGDLIEEIITRTLGTPSVRYIHVRNAEAGCFVAHVTRVEAVILAD